MCPNELTVPDGVAREITKGEMYRPWLGLSAEQAEMNYDTLEMLHETNQ